MEFSVTTPIEKIIPAEIGFNFEKLKAEISQKLKDYKGIVITEDNIKDCKADKATLNKLKKAISDKRISIKKEYLKPLDEFEDKVKYLVALVDEPITEIDLQLNAFDEKRKAEKLSAIKEIYENNIGELAELVSLDKISNPKWLNATYKISDIETEIKDTVTQINNDFKVIEDLKAECEVEIKNAYLRSFSLSEALAAKTQFEEQQKKLEELKNRQTAKSEPVQVEKVENQPLEQIDFRVWVTPGQKSALKNFLKAAEIKYGKVE